KSEPSARSKCNSCTATAAPGLSSAGVLRRLYRGHLARPMRGRDASAPAAGTAALQLRHQLLRKDLLLTQRRLGQNPSSAMALLEVRDLRITFPVNGGALTAVRGASFQIARGEIVGFLGESGCGKTSTALAILGLLPPAATCTGSVSFDGRRLIGLAE